MQQRRLISCKHCSKSVWVQASWLSHNWSIKRVCGSSGSVDPKKTPNRKWLMSCMSHICILRSCAKEILLNVAVVVLRVWQDFFRSRLLQCRYANEQIMSYHLCVRAALFPPVSFMSEMHVWDLMLQCLVSGQAWIGAALYNTLIRDSRPWASPTSPCPFGLI